MLLSWKVRYLDRGDKEFKDRELFLDLDSLPSEDRIKIELAIEQEKFDNNSRIFLKFRHLFKEGTFDELLEKYQIFNCFCIPDYFEDELGNELSVTEAMTIKHAKPNSTVVYLPDTRTFIEFSKPPTEEDAIKYGIEHTIPIDLSRINFIDKEIKKLNLFVDEIIILSSLPFKPPALRRYPELKVAMKITNAQLDSFVLRFRRLFMNNEMVNYFRICKLFIDYPEDEREYRFDHPMRLLWKRKKKEVDSLLKLPFGKLFPIKDLLESDDYEFTVKDLIDAFLYTKFVHQPNPDSEKLYKRGLIIAKGNKDVLLFYFCFAIYRLANEYITLGKWIKQILILMDKFSPESNHVEKLDNMSRAFERTINDKIWELANELWKKDGSPSCGAIKYKEQAELILRD